MLETVLLLSPLAMLLGLVSFSAGSRAASPLVQADLVFLNGKVWTVDKALPQGEAVAVWQDRILAVGTSEDIKALIGPDTRVIDLGGRLLLPGFNDNHTHFLMGGEEEFEVRLKDSKDEEEFGRRLAAKAKELPPGAWITGGNWDHDNWPGAQLPTAERIDRYVPDRPVFVNRYDGHMAVVNSVVLKIAGISAETPDPEGGVIVRKPGSREPAGVLRDNAMDLVYRHVPQSSDAEKRRAIEAAVAHARRVGVTSLQDMSASPALMRIYQDLFKEGELTVRIDARWPIASWKQLAELGIVQNFRNGDWIKIGGVKGFMDGSLGSSTALFFEPYAHEPEQSGVYMTPPETLRELILGADKAGLHVAIHAIGDKANSDLLDTFEEVARGGGPRERRFRIEHAQHIQPKDFERYARLGVIACAQPYHAIDDGRWAEGRIGRERCRTTYPFRSFLDAGVALCFGTDWTVAPLDPLQGIYAAVTRRTLDGKHPEGWFPEQKISVAEAIEAYTLGSAYAAFDENIKGTITPGKLADLVVLSEDILTIPPERIKDVVVLCTVVGGRVVYEK